MNGMDSYNRQVVDYLDKYKILETSDIIFAQQKGAESGVGLLEMLVSLNLLSSHERMQIDSHVQGIPHVSLTNRMLKSDILRVIPEPISRQYGVIAFDINGEAVDIAITQTGKEIHDILSEHVSGPYNVHLIDTDSLHYGLRAYQEYLLEEFGTSIRKKSKQLIPAGSYKHGDKAMPQRYQVEIMNNGSAEEILTHIISYAHMMSADSVFLSLKKHGCSVKMKIGSKTYDAMELSQHVFERLVQIARARADIDYKNDSSLITGTFSIETEQGVEHIDMTHVTGNASSELILEIVSQPTLFMNSYEMFDSRNQRDIYNNCIGDRSAKIILVGPKGSGITTTYYSLLERAVASDRKVLSFESSIEVDVSGVHQIVYRKEKMLTMLLQKSSSVNSDIVGCPDIQKAFLQHALGPAGVMKQIIARTSDIKSLTQIIDSKKSPVTTVVTHGTFKVSEKQSMRKLSQNDKDLIKRLFKRGGIITDLDLDEKYAHAVGRKMTKNIEIVRGVSRVTISDTQNTAALTTAVVKASVVENALLKAQQGSITINQIRSFITK